MTTFNSLVKSLIYLWQLLREQLHQVGNEPWQVAHDEHAHDGDGDAREPHVALAQRLSQLLAAAARVAPQLATHELVLAEGAVDEAIEDHEHGRGDDEVHQPVQEIDVHLEKMHIFFLKMYYRLYS